LFVDGVVDGVGMVQQQTNLTTFITPRTKSGQYIDCVGYFVGGLGWVGLGSTSKPQIG